MEERLDLILQYILLRTDLGDTILDMLLQDIAQGILDLIKTDHDRSQSGLSFMPVHAGARML
jgi:hypothetical protein